MHGPIERSRNNESSIYQRWGLGFLALPVFLVVALITMAIIQPATPTWIAEAAQAEFTGLGVMPELAPTQFAQPAMQIRTVRAY